MGTPAQCQNPHGGRDHRPRGDCALRLGDAAEWLGPIQARPGTAIHSFLTHFVRTRRAVILLLQKEAWVVTGFRRCR